MDDKLIRQHFIDFIKQYREALRIMQESVDLLEAIYSDIEQNNSKKDD